MERNGSGSVTVAGSSIGVSEGSVAVGKVESGGTSAAWDGKEIATWFEISVEEDGLKGPGGRFGRPGRPDSNERGSRGRGSGLGWGDYAAQTASFFGRESGAVPVEGEPMAEPMQPGDDVVLINAGRRPKPTELALRACLASRGDEERRDGVGRELDPDKEGPASCPGEATIGGRAVGPSGVPSEVRAAKRDPRDRAVDPPWRLSSRIPSVGGGGWRGRLVTCIQGPKAED
ncbi:hypothetical protein K2173_021946 [Erythroxylum novogranatense]|uniref:Uncharacterized protein n=1 Tax=Erythroxylum novogranatense TaxID=1862640 RepID=A0AAV8T3R6_9ROSI|nr:hypothetical protein K2173_021946 [Erythroxylum novogranatense]